MSARDDAVRAVCRELRTSEHWAEIAVDAAAPHLLAAHEAEVRAKVASEIAAAANFEPSCNEDIAHYDGLMFAARIANPTTTEADA